MLVIWAASLGFFFARIFAAAVSPSLVMGATVHVFGYFSEIPAALTFAVVNGVALVARQQSAEPQPKQSPRVLPPQLDASCPLALGARTVRARLNPRTVSVTTNMAQSEIRSTLQVRRDSPHGQQPERGAAVVRYWAGEAAMGVPAPRRCPLCEQHDSDQQPKQPENEAEESDWSRHAEDPDDDRSPAKPPREHGLSHRCDTSGQEENCEPDHECLKHKVVHHVEPAALRSRSDRPRPTPTPGAPPQRQPSPQR